MEVKSDLAALLSVAAALTEWNTILEFRWSKLEMALDTVVKTDSDAGTDSTSRVRTTAPREQDTLNEIDDILDARSS